MKSFFRNVSPRRAIIDFWQVLGTPSDYRAIALVLATIITGTIFVALGSEGGRGLPDPPKVIYFPSLIEGRTDAEILAENFEATAKVRTEEAEEEARQERMRQMYRAVGDATGVDTVKAYEEGKAERAAAKAKLDAERKAILDKHLVDNPVFDAAVKTGQAEVP